MAAGAAALKVRAGQKAGQVSRLSSLCQAVSLRVGETPALLLEALLNFQLHLHNIMRYQRPQPG